MRLLVILSIFVALSSFMIAADAPAQYSVNCVNCHGTDGRGNPHAALKADIPDLHSKAVQDLSDNEMYDTIALGVKHRQYPHAFLRRGLSERDIRELVKYIRSFAPAKK